MSPRPRNILLALCIAALALAQAPAKKAVTRAKASKPPAASASKLAPLPIIKKSALEKPTLEVFLRHLLAWVPPIEVALSDPKPSDALPGFFNVHAKATLGGRSAEEDVLISKDGQKILRGSVYGDPKPSEQLPGFVEVLPKIGVAAASQDESVLISKDGQRVVRAVVYDVSKNPFKNAIEKLNTQFQPSLGTPGASVVIVMFSDFQCPFCKDEAKMIRQNLISAYPKQVRLYFKDLPLEQLHPWAKPASIAGRCIFRQNAAAFWEYFDWIYENQDKINAENLKDKVLDWAKSKDVDLLQLTRCIDTRSTEADVAKNVADAQAVRVTSTPTLFVNGRPLVGQIGWPQLRQIIDYEIEYQKTARNAGEDCGCDATLQVPGATPAMSAAPLPLKP